MFKKNIKIELIPTDIILEDPIFKRIWNGVITQKFFIDGIAKFGVYTNPTGYWKGKKVHLLGHKCSLEAMIALKSEEIEMDIMNMEESDVALFLILFLCKEHKNLRCTIRLVRHILEYIATPDGKDWFKSILKKGDKEDRLAHILDISKYQVKNILLLLNYDSEEFIEIAETESLNAAVKAINAANEEIEKRKQNDSGTEGTSCTGNKKPQPETTSAGTDASIESTATDTENGVPTTGTNDTTQDDTKEEEESPEDVATKVAEYMPKGNQRNQGQTFPSFITKICAMLSDNSQIELDGISAMLTVDSYEIKSTERLAKQPNGNWIIPNYESFHLSVHSLE